MPKVSLHCHLEGTIAPATLLALAAKNDVALRPGARPDDVYAHASFLEFLGCFIDACRALAEPSDYARVAAEFVAYARAENIRRAEVFVSPAAWLRLHPTLDARRALEAIHDEFARADDREIVMLFDITRNFGPEVAETTVELALESRGRGVVGVGIGGDERANPAPAFARAFARAKAGGLRRTAHAGEDAGPESVRETLAHLDPERIGHGIRAAEDPALLALLAERRIVLEQSPGSNARTGVWTTEPHPIAACVAAGVPVAVDADDPAIFGITISSELARLAEAHGADFVFARLEDAIAGAFVDEARRAGLRAELDAARAAIPRGETFAGRE